MRHCARVMHFVRLASVVSLSLLQHAFGGVQDDVVPAPRLRPADVTRFSADSVKMGPGDIDEIRLHLRTSGRESLARRLTDKPSLSVMATNIDALSTLAVAPSFKLQEWALNALGERVPVTTNALSQLLTIVTNAQTDEHIKALAARIIVLSEPDNRALDVLLAQISRSPPELQVLLAELLGLSGPEARVVSGGLRGHLSAASGALQFNAMRAIYRIEGRVPDPPVSELDLAMHLMRASASDGAGVQDDALAVLEGDGSPMYLQCAALLALISADGTGPVVESILSKVAHNDAFVAGIGGNVLQRLRLDASAEPILGRALIADHAGVRLQSALALRRAVPGAGSATNAVAAALRRASQRGVAREELIALLEIVRAIGPKARGLGSALVPLLAEQSAIYSELPKGDVHHLRTWIFVAMADIGAPREALPAIMDALANTDESGGMLFAAAARAAATLGSEAADAVPFLIRPFQDTIAEQFVTFEAFGAHASVSGEYTTCELEALRALQQIGPAAAGALPALRSFLARPLPALANNRRFKRVPHPQKEALKTVTMIEAAAAEVSRP